MGSPLISRSRPPFRASRQNNTKQRCARRHQLSFSFRCTRVATLLLLISIGAEWLEYLCCSFRVQAWQSAAIGPLRDTSKFVKQLSSSTSTENRPAASHKVDPSEVLSKRQMGQVSELVSSRATARWNGDYELADTLRRQILNLTLPHGYEIDLNDIPRNQGGGTHWTLLMRAVPNITDAMLMDGPTVLQLAHAALGLAVSSSKMGSIVPIDQLESLITQTKHRLSLPGVDEELRGRKAADALFWFSLAGVEDCQLNEVLIGMAISELHRYGARPSCRAKDIWQVVTRLAASVVLSPADQVALEMTTSNFLKMKKEEGDHQSLNNNLNRSDEGECQTTNLVTIDFHLDRCLLMLWKFSTRQKKQKAFLESALRHWERNRQTSSQTGKSQKQETIYDWDCIFDDPTKPLVIDIGCGMGVSLLGLARIQDTDLYNQNAHDEILCQWNDCNFAGADLGALGVNYANGMAKKFHMANRLRFFIDDAESFVSAVLKSYPGQLKAALVQFPTPFRLQGKTAGSGNTQLPDEGGKGFMVSKELLSLLKRCLYDGDDSFLLLQSNCEDVAIWMRQTALEVGFEAGSFNSSRMIDEQIPPSSPTKRTLDWIQMGGTRAEGDGWIKFPVLPRIGRTETEVACTLNGTPVHRCLLRKKP